MSNSMKFFKRLTAFLLALLLFTSMVGDDFSAFAGEGGADEYASDQPQELIEEESLDLPDDIPEPVVEDVPEEDPVIDEPVDEPVDEPTDPPVDDIEIPTTPDEVGTNDAVEKETPEIIDEENGEEVDEEELEEEEAEEEVLEEEEECEHKWTYTSHGDGTHTKKCELCGEESDEACTFGENGKCIYCGYGDTTLEYKKVTQEIMGTVVTVEGDMPKNATVSIKHVYAKAAEQIVNRSLEENEFKAYVAFDITIYDLNGNEYQPQDDNNTIKVTFKNVDEIDQADEEAEIVVYRIEDDYSITKIDSSVSGNDVSFEADHFTTYLTGEESSERWAQFYVNIHSFAYINNNTSTNESYITINKAKFRVYANNAGSYKFNAYSYKDLTDVNNPTSGTKIGETKDITVSLNAGWNTVELSLTDLGVDKYVAYGKYYSVVVEPTISPDGDIKLGFGKTGTTFTFIYAGAWEKEEAYNAIFIENEGDTYTLVDTIPSDGITITGISGPDPSSCVSTNVNPYSPKTFLYSVGDTGTFTAILSDPNATRNITWSVTGNSITIIDPKTGKFKATNAGESTVTATYGGSSDSITVNVIDFYAVKDDSEVPINGGSIPSYTYTGKEIKPTINGYLGAGKTNRATLETITATDNIDVTNAASVAIPYIANGKTFTFTRTFKITKKDLDSVNFDNAVITIENGVVTDVIVDSTNPSAGPIYERDFTFESLTPATSLDGKQTTIIFAGIGNYEGNKVVTKVDTENHGITVKKSTNSLLDTWIYKGTAWELEGDLSRYVVFKDSEGNSINIARSDVSYEIRNKNGTSEDAISAGEKTLIFTITKECGLKGKTLSVDFYIEQANLANATVTWTNRSFPYDGNPKKPVTPGDFKVMFKGEPVNADDYNLSYEGNNVDVSTATVYPYLNIESTNKNFKNSSVPVSETRYEITANFENNLIVRVRDGSQYFTGEKDSNNAYQIPYNKIYDGTGAPKFYVNIGTKEYTETTDFTVAVVNNDDGSGTAESIAKVGKKKVTITPTDTGRTNGLTGTVTAYYSVVPRNLTVDMVDMSKLAAKKIYYTGQEIGLDTAAPGSSTPYDVKVTYDGTILTRGVDYTLTPSNNINIGYATFTIKGVEGGNFTGTLNPASFKFKINPVALTTDETSNTLAVAKWGENVSNIKYDGTKKTPAVAVTINSKSVDAANYDISYGTDTDNIAVGKGFATITGKGNLTGTVTLPFDIRTSDVAFTSIKIDGIESTNKKIREETVNGTTTRYYICPVETYYNGEMYNGNVSINDGSLVYKTDYTYVYLYAKETKEWDTTGTTVPTNCPQLVIYGTGNYRNNNAIVYFQIKKIDLSDTTNNRIELSEKNLFKKKWSGSAISFEDFELKVNDKVVDAADYTITYDADNVNAGNKTFTLSANTTSNNYKGTVPAEMTTYTIGTDISSSKIKIIDSRNASNYYVGASNEAVANVSTQSNPYSAYYRGYDKSTEQGIRPVIIELYDENGKIDSSKYTENEEATTLGYKSRTDMSEATDYNTIPVTFEGVKNQGTFGQLKVWYEIRPADISTLGTFGSLFLVNSTDTSQKKFTGETITITPEIYFNNMNTPETEDDIRLMAGHDFRPGTVSIGSSVGTVSHPILYGMGNYTGKIDGNLTYSIGKGDVYFYKDADSNSFGNSGEVVGTNPKTEFDVTTYVYKKGTRQCPDIKVKNASKGDLVLGTDYSITYPDLTDSYNPGTYTITVIIKGSNYNAGTYHLNYEITTTAIDETGKEYEVSVNDVVYNGRDVTLDRLSGIKVSPKNSSVLLEKVTSGSGNNGYELVDAAHPLTGPECTTLNNKYGTSYVAGEYFVTSSLPSESGNYFFVRGSGVYSGVLRVPFRIVLPLDQGIGLTQIYMADSWYELDANGAVITTDATKPYKPIIKYKGLNSDTYSETLGDEMADGTKNYAISRSREGLPGEDGAITITGKGLTTGLATSIKAQNGNPVCFKANLGNYKGITMASGSELDYTGNHLGDQVEAMFTGLYGDKAVTGNVSGVGDYTFIFQKETYNPSSSGETVVKDVGKWFVTVAATAGSKYYVENTNTADRFYFYIKFNLNTAEMVFENELGYTGANQTVPVVVKCNGFDLYNWRSPSTTYINVDPAQIKEMGQYQIHAVIQDSTKVKGSLHADFYVKGVGIAPEDITIDLEPSVSGIQDHITYTGSPITLTTSQLVVRVNGTTLVKDKDYTVSYSGNLNAGIATVTITGKGGYSGTQSATFTIDPKEITDDMITVDPCVYAGMGKPVKPDVTIKNGNHILAKGNDFIIDKYEHNDGGAITEGDTNPPYVFIKLGTSGNYKLSATNQAQGYIKKAFTISPLDISGTEITLDPAEVEYNGEDQSASGNLYTIINKVLSNGNTLKPYNESNPDDTYDYKLSAIRNNTVTALREPGDYFIRVEGDQKNTIGSVDKPFKITERSLASEYHYYFDDDKMEFKGTWRYEPDLDPGKDGKQPGYFCKGGLDGDDLEIKVFDVIEVVADGENYPQVVIVDKGVKDPDTGVAPRSLTSDDYDLSYNNYDNVGTAEWVRKYTDDKHALVAADSPSVTITGKGKYSGEITLPYNIGKNINNLGLTITFTTGTENIPTYTYANDGENSHWTYVYNNVQHQPTKITITQKDDNNRDVPFSNNYYDITYTDLKGDEDECINAGYKYVVITGVGNYCGTISQKFQINRKKISAQIYQTNTNEQESAFTNESPRYYATDNGQAESTTNPVRLSFSFSGSGLARLKDDELLKKYLVDTKLLPSMEEAAKYKNYYFGIYSGEEFKPDITITDNTLGTLGKTPGVISSNDIEITSLNNNQVSSFGDTPIIASATVSFKSVDPEDFNTGGNYYVMAGGTSVSYKFKYIIVPHDLMKDFNIQLIDEEGHELTDNIPYKGTFARPSVRVTDGSRELVQGETNDYTIEYINNHRPGKATVKVTGCNNYMGEKSIDFDIVGKLEDTEFYYFDTDSQTYVEGIADQFGIEEAVPEGEPRIYIALPVNGTNITKIEPLTYGTDYEVESIGIGHIQYKGTGKYWTGVTRDATYNIRFNPATDVEIRGLDPNGYKYTGNAIKPEISLSISAAKLDDVEYYRNYGESGERLLTAEEDFIDVGTITVIATYHLRTGPDNDRYTTAPASYNIISRRMSDCKVVFTRTNRYTGTQIKPPVTVFILDDDGKAIKLDSSNYSVAYGENIFGYLSVTLTGTGNNIQGTSIEVGDIVIGAPVNLKAKSDGATVTATWVHDIYSAGEQIRICKLGSTIPVTSPKTLTGKNQKYVFSEGLDNVTNYVVQIRSYQVINGSTEYSSDWGKAPSYIVATGISNNDVTVDSYTTGTATVTWDPEGDAVIYEIYRANDAISEGEKIAVYPASTGAFTNSQLTSGRTYYYYIVGYSLINNELKKISESEHKPATIK
jgi:hypothetical protein